jgi:two-component system cell cycle response regulator DivK
MAKILVVEDNPANARLAEFLLRKAGHEVLAAEEAATGIALAREKQPDLVLMDIQLPGMDGLEATRQLKADPATSKIPVLALTALAMKGDAERILAAGCNGYLAKPYGHDQFLKAVQAALGPAPKARRRAGRR